MSIGWDNAGRTELYVLAGQSNADGRADKADLPPEHRYVPDSAEYYYNGVRYDDFAALPYLGPASSLLYTLRISRPQKRIVLVHCVLGSTSLYTCWQPPLYDSARGAVTNEGVERYKWHSLQSSLAVAIGRRTIRRVAFCWWQGETDALFLTAANTYASGLDNLFANVVSFVGSFERLVIARIRYLPQSAEPGIVTVRTAQSDAVNTKPGGMTTQVLDFDDLPVTTDVHVNSAGAITAGQRFAAAYNAT